MRIRIEFYGQDCKNGDQQITWDNMENEMDLLNIDRIYLGDYGYNRDP